MRRGQQKKPERELRLGNNGMGLEVHLAANGAEGGNHARPEEQQ